MTTPHPSFLELDKLAVGAGSSGSRSHADSCSECAGYLARVQRPAPLPDWVRAGPAKSRARWTWPAITLAGALAGSLALALVALSVWRPGELHGERDRTATKGGTPGLAIFVKRGDAAEAWDGRQPIRPGDSLRLQVAPEGYQHIVVDSSATRSPTETPGRHLFDGPLPSAIGFLPISWRVDAQNGPEVLEITLTSESRPVWHARIVLPKTVP